jgi:cytochrome P450
VILSMIEQKRRDPCGDDLLSMLVNLRDEESGKGMSDRQLRDEVATLFVAGHETTANAMAWTLNALAHAPRVRDQLETEIEAYFETGDFPATGPDARSLMTLRYTGLVAKESLRLYPPAWIIGRQNLTDDMIGGYGIPAGTNVLIPSYVIHRDPRWWEDPLEFRPERFETEHFAQAPRFAYFPFGGGPRLCIGQGFAQLEMQALLVALCRRFRFDALPGEHIEKEFIITMRPKHGMPMRLSRRI